jgi:membrane protease YdiL (CAAX protease family)
VDRPERASLGIVTFVVWPFIAAGLLLAATLLAGRRGLTVPETVFGTIFYAGLAAWTLYRARRAPFNLDLGALSRRPARRSDWRYLLLVIPLLVTSAAALYLVMFVASFVAPQLVGDMLATPEPPSEAATPRSLPGDLVESAIGAIAEEWLFRGVLLHVWAQRFGVRFAVLATSILFAALHSDVIGSVIFGIAMAALYIRTGSLLVPIVAHFLFNALVATGAIVLGDDGATTLSQFRQDWWQATSAFAAAVAVIVIVLRRAIPGTWVMPGGLGRTAVMNGAGRGARG